MTARATLAALAMLLGACCLPGEYCGDLEISILNETAEAVVVFGVGEDGEEVQVIDLLPGQGLPVRNILDRRPRLLARTRTGCATGTRGRSAAGRDKSPGSRGVSVRRKFGAPDRVASGGLSVECVRILVAGAP